MQNYFTKYLSAEIDPAYAKRAELILSSIEKLEPSTVLEIGCGRGFYLKAMQNIRSIKKIIGIDANQQYIEIAKENCSKSVNIIQAKAENIPVKDNSIECVIISEVLEHVENDEVVLKEILRVLKPKGRLIVTVPNSNYPILWDPINWIMEKTLGRHVDKDRWWLAGIWADHERLYSKTQINALLVKFGFVVNVIEPVITWSWPFMHFLLYGLGKNIVERTNLLKSCNRFEPTQGTVPKFIAKITRMPSDLLDKGTSSISVGWFISSEKQA